MKTIKITEIAKKIGVNHSAVSHWKANKKIPPSRIFEIAELINVEPIELHQNPNLFFDLTNKSIQKQTAKN